MVLDHKQDSAQRAVKKSSTTNTYSTVHDDIQLVFMLIGVLAQSDPVWPDSDPDTGTSDRDASRLAS